MGDLVDFVHVPRSFETNRNFGYAFLNLVTYEERERFKTMFQGFTSWPVPHQQTCEVHKVDSCKNIDDYIKSYRNSPVMHESVSDQFKPAIYKNGERQSFPPPTKPIRADMVEIGVSAPPGSRSVSNQPAGVQNGAGAQATTGTQGH